MVDIQGLCTSLSQAGGFFGFFFNAWSADKYGRLTSFQIASTIVIIGSALQAGAVNIPMFLVFRFISGFGVGMILVLFPMYAAELSPPRARGFLVGQHGLCLAIGYNAAGAVSLGCFFAKNGALAWRLPLAIQWVFPNNPLDLLVLDAQVSSLAHSQGSLRGSQDCPCPYASLPRRQ